MPTGEETHADSNLTPNLNKSIPRNRGPRRTTVLLEGDKAPNLLITWGNVQVKIKSFCSPEDRQHDIQKDLIRQIETNF